jgi:Asp-tRNA(Asn)/Glu-tRNA(Gln) amidotransferase A subunit family amidase
MDEIWRWSAVRIAAAIRKREISAKDALEASLARMSAVNPKLNAVTVDLSVCGARRRGARRSRSRGR